METTPAGTLPIGTSLPGFPIPGGTGQDPATANPTIPRQAVYHA